MNLVQYLVDHQVTHTAIDTDNENSTLKRFHPAAEFVDLAHSRDLDRIFTRMETTDLAVVDCRAASSELFLDHFAEVRWADVLKAKGAQLTPAILANIESGRSSASDILVPEIATVFRVPLTRLFPVPPVGRPHPGLGTSPVTAEPRRRSGPDCGRFMADPVSVCTVHSSATLG